MGYVMSGFGAAGTESGYTPPPDDLPPPEGYPPVERCSDYVIRGDGWCADTSGVYPLSWYDIAAGSCVTPPPAAQVSSPGRAFASCSSSFTVRTGSEGWATST